MNEATQLGQLIENGNGHRDAVHIAVAPVTAAEKLRPGQHVGFAHEGNRALVAPTDRNIGIVDPFLSNDVEAGQQFWLLLFPNTVTGMRHVWSHPAFQLQHKLAETNNVRRSDVLS